MSTEGIIIVVFIIVVLMAFRSGSRSSNKVGYKPLPDKLRGKQPKAPPPPPPPKGHW